MAYATLAQVKSAMSLGASDVVDDGQITLALAAAEQMIDGYCGRSFATAGTATSTRVYRADSPYHISIDDATTITAVQGDPAEDGTWQDTWTTADWQAEPLNGRKGALTVPYDRLVAIGDYLFPVSRQACVRVTATWGWAAVPDVVEQATIQTTMRLWKKLSAPLGVTGGPDTGLLYVSRQIDGDVAQLLRPYRKAGLAMIGLA